MPKERFRIPSLEGFDPAVEPRGKDETRIISGENFIWDSMGPKSGFGTFLLGGGQVIEEPDGVVQSIELGTNSLIFTSKKVWMLNDENTAFTEIYDLVPLFGAVIDPWRKKWTGAYLSKGIYLAHYDYGLFKLERDGLAWVMTPKDQDDIPGIPYQPIAVCEAAGRLLILGRKYFGWSNASEPEEWTPEIGGAGQQLLSDRVAGRAVTMDSYQNGALIWTEQDCLIAEFIGGDFVFRYDRMQTKHIPLGAWGVERLPDGSQLIAARQGIFRTSNGSIPESITPTFNEFMRTRMEKRDFLQVRLTYVIDSNLLYVQFRDWTNHYVETYVLSLALDRWGVFNERHYGIIRYRNKRGAFGYVDNLGVAHRFVEHLRQREVLPGGTFVGLNSKLEIGYIKPPNLHAEIDTLLEMQEIFVGSQPSRPSWSELNTIDLGDLPIFQPAADYEAYLRFHTTVPVYWVRHAGAPDGEFFETREELLSSVVALNPNDEALGMKVSIPEGADPDDYPQPIAQNELLEAIQALVASVDGVTFVVEVDTALQHEADLLWMQDGPMDSIIRVLGWHDYPSGNYPNQRPNFARLYSFLEMMDEWGMDEYEPAAATHAWDVNRIAFSIKHFGGGTYRFALAVNGIAVFSYDSNSVYHPTWVPAIVRIGITPTSYVQDAGPVLYNNDSYLRKFIVYNDGDDASVVARSIPDDRIEPLEVTGGNPVNANATTLEVTDGELQLLIPAETVVGDRLIAVIYGRSVLTPPEGWVLVGSQLYERDFFWNADFPGGVMNRVDLALTQTTYIYTKVTQLADIGAAVRWPFATPGICGGVITNFHRPDGTTPVILNSSVVKNQNDIDSGIELRESGGLQYAYRGVEGTEYVSTRHDAVAFLAVVAGMVANCYQYNSPALAVDFAMSEISPDTTAQYLDDGVELRPVFSEGQTGIGGATVPTMQGTGLYWQSWNYVTSIIQEERNRMLVAWKYLPRNQELVTRRVEGGQAKGMFFTHYTTNLDLSSTVYTPDPATVVGTLLIA